MPYTPPEVFDLKHDCYDFSQDMFSFGVMCYLIVFDRDPFYLTESIFEGYRTKKYMNRLFLAEEIGSQICYQPLFDLLLSFIMRCMDPNPLMRPTPSWACLLYTSPSPRDQRGSRMPSSA